MKKVLAIFILLGAINGLPQNKPKQRIEKQLQLNSLLKRPKLEFKRKRVSVAKQTTVVDEPTSSENIQDTENYVKHGYRYSPEYFSFVQRFRREQDRLTKEDIARREQNFFHHLSEFGKHNKNNTSYQIGLTVLSDRNPVNAITERCKARMSPTARALPYFAYPPAVAISRSLDYTRFAPPVRNQGVCGSCWAFAVVALIETKNAMADSSFNTTLSEQYLVDCDSYNSGCEGGWPLDALNWIMQNSPSIATLASYPYSEKSYLEGESGSCNSSTATTVPSNFSDFNTFKIGGNVVMAKYLLKKYGPLVSVMAAPYDASFTNYVSGIYTGPCSTGRSCKNINHVVVLMGYGVDPETGMEFWIVRNSWSTDWGEQGYFRLPLDNRNYCSIICQLSVIEYSVS